MFLILSLAVGGYTLYRFLKDGTPLSEMVSLWVLPVIFILIYYGSDTLLDKIFHKKKQINYEEKFIEEMPLNSSATFAVKSASLRISIAFSSVITL